MIRIWMAAAMLVLGLVPFAAAQERGDLERYAALARSNPLYGWPGVDLTKMRDAVAALQGSRDEILRFAGAYDARQQARIAQNLYPTAYLTEMIALEQVRRRFLEAADRPNAAAYRQKLLQTVRAQITYMSNLIPALNATAQEAPHKGLESHFGQSSFQHFIAGINSYHQQALAAEEREQSRWACFLGEAIECESPRWITGVYPEEVTYDLSMFERLPARMNWALRMQGLLGGQAVGPGWALLNQSRCDLADGPVPFLLWAFPTASGIDIFRADVVSDLLVHDHRIDVQSNAYERILDSLGMDGFLFQSQTKLYACPDASQYSAQLRAMVYVAAFAQTFDWSAVANDRDLAAGFARLVISADELGQGGVLTENAVHRFANQLTRLLRDHERGALMSTLGPHRTQQLETAALAYRLHTPMLNNDVMNLIYGNTAIADYVPYANWGFLEELLFTRNAPDLLLGGTNPSIFAEPYAQIEQRRAGVSPRLRSYVQDLSAVFGEEDFTDILLLGLIAEHRLGRFQHRPYLFAD